MKNLLKIGLVTITAGVFTSGCFGCGNRTSSAPEEPAKITLDSPKQKVDTTKAIDTAKKDTSKK